ncbi:hypothetical protein SUGI_0687880 [Cryptomeria japonica]|nr:hypothetical protein SUGI_0687880 [Cryptomeria japonica]
MYTIVCATTVWAIEHEILTENGGVILQGCHSIASLDTTYESIILKSVYFNGYPFLQPLFYIPKNQMIDLFEVSFNNF